MGTLWTECFLFLSFKLYLHKLVPTNTKGSAKSSHNTVSYSVRNNDNDYMLGFTHTLKWLPLKYHVSPWWMCWLIFVLFIIFGPLILKEKSDCAQTKADTESNTRFTCLISICSGITTPRLIFNTTYCQFSDARLPTDMTGPWKGPVIGSSRNLPLSDINTFRTHSLIWTFSHWWWRQWPALIHFSPFF